MHTLWKSSLVTLLLTASCALVPLQGHAAGPTESRPDHPDAEGAYELRSVWTIGGPNAEDAAQFFERMGPVSFAADAKGRLYVLDNGNHRVQVFGPDGRFLRSFGHEGEGPGEFSLPRAIAVNGRGDCAVHDIGTQRVSIFGPDGELVRDQLVTGVVREMTLTDDGVLLCSIPNRYDVVAYDEDGEIVWEAGEQKPSSTRREIQIETDYQTVASRLVLLEDDVLLASNGAYSLTRYADGSERARWSRPFERRKLEMPEPAPDGESGEDGTQVVMIVRQQGGEGGGGGGTGSAQSWSSQHGGDGETTINLDTDELRRMMPEHVPDVRGVLTWPDGRAWVVTAEDDGDRMVTDEWDADGRYLRRFTIPRYSWLAVGPDGSLYGLTHDDDDYPIVHRLEAALKS